MANHNSSAEQGKIIHTVTRNMYDDVPLLGSQRKEMWWQNLEATMKPISILLTVISLIVIIVGLTHFWDVRERRDDGTKKNTDEILRNQQVEIARYTEQLAASDAKNRSLEADGKHKDEIIEILKNTQTKSEEMIRQKDNIIATDQINAAAFWEKLVSCSNCEVQVVRVLASLDRKESDKAKKLKKEWGVALMFSKGERLDEIGEVRGEIKKAFSQLRPDADITHFE